jgi:uncharacterized protein
MGASSTALHESEDRLQAATIDRHRAIVSLQEELEAIDWYDQRIDATTDEALKEILEHNRDEEKEHASMVLEWLRRQDPAFERALREYLFSEGSITGREEQKTESAEESDGSLGIGSLRGVR